MTLGTASNLEMGLSRVAHAARRDYLFLAYHRRMALMAVHAAHRGLMLASVLVDRPYHIGVTFHAVGVGQLRRFGRLRRLQVLEMESDYDKEIPKERIRGRQERAEAVLHDIFSPFQSGLFSFFTPFINLYHRKSITLDNDNTIIKAHTYQR